MSLELIVYAIYAVLLHITCECDECLEANCANLEIAALHLTRFPCTDSSRVM